MCLRLIVVANIEVEAVAREEATGAKPPTHPGHFSLYQPPTAASHAVVGEAARAGPSELK